MKGGRYALTDGDWHLKTRAGPRLIASCPLDESKLAALDLHDDTEEKSGDDLQPVRGTGARVSGHGGPDPHIESLASRKGVYLIWRTDALVAWPVGDCPEPGCARSAIRGADRPGGLRGYRAGSFALNMAGCRCASIAEVRAGGGVVFPPMRLR